jgi:AraC family transcriptional activator of pobA
MSITKRSEFGHPQNNPTKKTGNHLEAFKICKVDGAHNNNLRHLLIPEEGYYHLIFFQKRLTPIRNLDLENNQYESYSILFQKGQLNGIEEILTGNLTTYCCAFKSDFLSITGDSMYPLSFFSFFRQEEESIINIPCDRVERFSLIFDLIYSIYKSAIENKAILIASYLIVILQEANILYNQFYDISRSNLKATAELITRRFKNFVGKYYLEKQTVKAYAEMLCITPNHLSKIIKTTTGRTALQLIIERILADAKALLRLSSMNVSEIAYSLGFEDTSYFHRLFKKKTGVTPLKYRRMDFSLGKA